MRRIILLLSGGLDSTVLLYHLVNEGFEVKCLSFDYGQRHSRELMSAKVVAEVASCDHEVVDLKGVGKVFTKSSLVNSSVPIPYGHYEEPSMKSTVVPNRNMIMLSVACAKALNDGFEGIAYAAHAGDHAIYPDCRPEFFKAMQVAISLCDWGDLKLLCPFIHKTKVEIVNLGILLGAPMGLTWTCYEGGVEPCGKCGSCVERKEAFELNNIEDK